MARIGLSASLILFTWLAPAGAQLPAVDDDAAFRNMVAVQKAQEQARFFLNQKSDAKRAVEILEGNLSRINGDPVYLRLLRDAYRAYINDLTIARQENLLRKYKGRLAILEGGPVTLQPLAKTPAPKPASSLLDKALSPGVKLVQNLSPSKLGLPLLGKPQPPTVRAKLDDDPFDPAYRRAPKVDAARQEQARKLLAQAEAEYSKRRFIEARLLYEEAYQADKAVVAPCLSRWGYCKLSHVVDQLNQPKLDAARLPGLEQEVRLAMDMAPPLTDSGKWLLREIEQRRQAPATPMAQPAPLTFAVQHKGRVQGWQLAETPHFRIFHNQSPAFAEKVARQAEQTRQDMYRKWFGNDGPAWNPKCDLFLHSTAQDYQRATGVPAHSPGHSRFETENTGRIIGRRMDLHCDVPTMLDAVLPHETTHVVLAGQFGRHVVPRWADEGMAVLTEPRDKVDQHRRNMVRSHREGQLFTVRDLMQMQDYPHGRRIAAFYAQSVILVEFLTNLRGPRVFAEFLQDGLNGGYEAALTRHYGIRDFNDLQTRWNQQVTAAAQRFEPAVAGR